MNVLFAHEKERSVSINLLAIFVNQYRSRYLDPKIKFSVTLPTASAQDNQVLIYNHLKEEVWDLSFNVF